MDHNPIINRLLEVPESDERTMDFYITGLLVPLRKLYADTFDENKATFAIPEEDVRALIKKIISQNLYNKIVKELTNG